MTWDGPHPSWTLLYRLGFESHSGRALLGERERRVPQAEVRQPSFVLAVRLLLTHVWTRRHPARFGGDTGSSTEMGCHFHHQIPPRLGGTRRWGLSPTLDRGLSGPPDPGGLGVGRFTLWGAPHPLFSTLKAVTLAPATPQPWPLFPPLRHGGRAGGGCTCPGCPSVLHAGWSTALGRPPSPNHCSARQLAPS